MESDYLKAGKIASDAIVLGKKLIKEGALLLDVTCAIEEEIFKHEAKLAFPVNISINHIAAHNIVLPNDSRTFTKNDIIKLDIGVHVNGFVADTAITIDLTGKNARLVKASEDALNEALKIIKPGTSVNEIGKVIHEKISSFGFSPIKNLSGHILQQYKVHGNLTIPNYDNNDNTKLEEGMVIAIEPFATTGEGIVIEGKPSGIFRLESKKPIRDLHARNILEAIEKGFRTLPFSRRSINLPMRDFALSTLEKEGIIIQYAQLIERSHGLVSQFEHTVIVKEKPIVTTAIL
ncbi:type II methionyl aminopeptidase [Candidatus Woesearchaeota archaeon]|nr:type II methionyl aminopeptidase [Candidatus Woesearchaeota archaeon]